MARILQLFRLVLTLSVGLVCVYLLVTDTSLLRKRDHRQFHSPVASKTSKRRFNDTRSREEKILYAERLKEKRLQMMNELRKKRKGAGIPGIVGRLGGKGALMPIMHQIRGPWFDKNGTLEPMGYALQDHVVNPHNFSYINHPGNMCEDEDLFLFMYVHTSPKHYLNRMLIRNTWGNQRFYTDFKLKVRKCRPLSWKITYYRPSKISDASYLNNLKA